MHRVYERCMKEIDEILECELTPSSLEILGELVDIIKDIENIRYWKGSDKSEKVFTKENIHDKSKRDIESMIKELEYIAEQMKKGESHHDKDKVKSDEHELLESAIKIKSILSAMPLDTEVMARYKEVFK